MAKITRPHMARVKKGWDRSLWASKKPFGIGEQHPNNFAEITRAIRGLRGKCQLSQPANTSAADWMSS